jgi:hypothetical protein
LDSPSDGRTVSGSYRVSGWFLDPKGVSRIEIFVDGVSVGDAVYGSQRLDVAKAYTAYNNPNSGFSFTLDTLRLGNNMKHTVVVEETSTTGAKTKLAARTFIVSNP